MKRMKLNFKKIASVLAGTVMLSSTIAFAAAANTYPTPFVKNGSADVAVVYGSNAGGELDLLAVVDITNSLQAKLAAQTASSGSSTTVTTTGGDSYQLQKSSTKFNLGSGIADVVSTSVTDDDLPTLLANGVYTDTNNDEFDYTQEITLTNQSVALFEDNDYKADTPVIGMRIASGANVMNYTLSFTDEPDWADLSNTDLTLMGKQYYILSKSSTVGDSLTLLDSADSLTISEGETKNVTLGGKSYSVKVNYVGSTPNTKLEINGEVTKSLAVGGTYKLKDGTYVGIKEVNYNGKDTGVSNVEFSLGTGKLLLTDALDIELNDEAVNDVKAYFTNSSSTKLSSIKIAWYASDDLFATNDSSIVMPGFNATKISFAGMTFPASEKIAVEPSGDDSFVLKNFPLKSGAADINLLYWNGTGFTQIGKDSTNLLRTSNESSITFDGDTDAYFVASWSDGNDAESYLMRATSFILEDGSNKTTIQYKKDGSWTNIKEKAKEGNSVSIGNVDLSIGAVDKDAKTVVLSYTGSKTSFNTLYSAEGMKVYLPFNSSTSSKTGVINLSAAPSIYLLKFSEENADGDLGEGQNITLTLGGNSQGDTSVTTTPTLTKGSSAIENGDSKVDTMYVYSPLATEVSYDRSGDQRKATLTYHGDESYANVFLSAPNTVVSASAGSSGSVKELGTVFLKDTEVSQVSDKNLIVVGGSCVNKLSSELLGGAACGTSWETKTEVGAGAFLIQTFERTGGKVATLVAGYNVDDTRNAARVLVSDASLDLSAGKKYKSTSATSVQLVTTAA